MLKSVVLPAPFGPIRSMMEPKDLEIASILIMIPTEKKDVKGLPQGIASLNAAYNRLPFGDCLSVSIHVMNAVLVAV